LILVLLLISALGALLFLLLLLLGTLDVEPDLANAVVLVELLICGFNDDVVFVDSRICNFGVIEPENRVA